MSAYYATQPVIDAKLALEPECSLTEVRAEKRVRYDKNGFNRPDHTNGSQSVSPEDAKLASIIAFTSSTNINAMTNQSDTIFLFPIPLYEKKVFKAITISVMQY